MYVVRPKVHNSHIKCKGNRIKNNLKDGNWKNYITLFKTKGSKSWVKTNLHKMRCEKIKLHIYLFKKHI